MPTFSGGISDLRTDWHKTSILSNYTKVIIMFIEIPANKRSISKRKPVFGVGINDADYIVCPLINGKQAPCPFYKRWHCMIKRCYSVNYQESSPTYKECTVCDEWLTFSNFKRWMKRQEWEGLELDKDILQQGNKVYSPEMCIFVTGKINSLLISQDGDHKSPAQGVSLHERYGKYHARCRKNGSRVSLGYFDTKEEASAAYKSFKYKLILDIALLQSEPLRSALIKYKIKDRADTKDYYVK